VDLRAVVRLTDDPFFFRGLALGYGSKREAARKLRIPESTLRGLIEGRAQVSDSTILKLQKSLDSVPPEIMRNAKTFERYGRQLTPNELQVLEQKVRTSEHERKRFAAEMKSYRNRGKMDETLIRQLSPSARAVPKVTRKRAKARVESLKSNRALRDLIKRGSRGTAKRASRKKAVRRRGRRRR
jgi:plasmid maintenance system antidote protein VapI